MMHRSEFLRRAGAMALTAGLTLSVPALAAEPTQSRQEDLDRLMAGLETAHPDLFANTPKLAFHARKAEIEARPVHRERCGISLRPPESDGPGRGLPHRRAGGRQDHRPGLRLPHGPFLAGREVVSHHRAGGAQGSAGHAGHRSQWPGHGIHCPGLRTGPQRRQPGEAPAAVPAGM